MTQVQAAIWHAKIRASTMLFATTRHFRNSSSRGGRVKATPTTTS